MQPPRRTPRRRRAPRSPPVGARPPRRQAPHARHRRRDAGARTRYSRSPGPPRLGRRGAGDGPLGDRVCNGQPRPRSAPRGSPRPRRRSSPRDTMTAPTRRTTSSPSPACSNARSMFRTHDQRGDELAARARDRNRDPRRRAAPQADHPEHRKLPSRLIGRPRRRRCGDQRRGPARTENRRPPPLIRPHIEALVDHRSALEQSGRGAGFGVPMTARVRPCESKRSGAAQICRPLHPHEPGRLDRVFQELRIGRTAIARLVRVGRAVARPGESDSGCSPDRRRRQRFRLQIAEHQSRAP